LNNLNSLKNSLNTGSKNKILSAIVITLFIASIVFIAAPVKAQALDEIHGQSPSQNGWIGSTTNKDPPQDYRQTTPYIQLHTSALHQTQSDKDNYSWLTCGLPSHQAKANS